MKVVWTIMVVLIIFLQVRLWVGEGSYAQVWQIDQKIEAQKAENATLSARNDRLYAEVRNLRSGRSATEERARQDLGLIRDDETFFLVVKP